jgi:hypothetical protein
VLGLSLTYFLASPVTCDDWISKISTSSFYFSEMFSQKMTDCVEKMSVNFESHKLLEAVFDVTRCALSNEINLEQIYCADMTKLPDLAEHVFFSW